MPLFLTAPKFWKRGLCLMVLLGACGAWLQAQPSDAPATTIEQIIAKTDSASDSVLSDDVLLQVMQLYAGSWKGSVDLTDKYGTVVQTLAVESEYRMQKDDGQTVLLGRVQFGRGDRAKYATSRTEVANGFLMNRINQQGKNTVYRGEIEEGKIAWREYGVPRSEYDVFYEAFGDSNGRRIYTTQSRNQMRDQEGKEQVFFTAGRYVYGGAVREWTLPLPSFSPDNGTTSVRGESEVAAGGSSAPSMTTLGELTDARAASVAAQSSTLDPARAVESSPAVNPGPATSEISLADQLKLARAEAASLQAQLEAEQASSGKLRARIAELEKKLSAYTGDPVTMPEIDVEREEDAPVRTPFRSRTR